MAEKDIRKIQIAFKERGLTGVAFIFKELTAEWEQKRINVGVIGRSGVGKSAFINAIRGDLSEHHRDYAPVGHTECTYERQSYPHPDNDNLVFWDLPGLGTGTFPRKEYLNHHEINIGSYDIFVIVTCDRYTEDEIWLADEIKKLNKMFMFVRTKVGTQVESDKILKEKACKVSEKLAVIEEIREDCKIQLGRNFKDQYLISSMEIDDKDLDFSKLLRRFTSGFQELRFEIFVHSLRSLTIPTVEQNLNSMRCRMIAVGNLARFIPDAIAEAIIDKNVKYYRKHFGISDDHLEILAAVMKNTVEDITKEYELTATTLNISVMKRIFSIWPRVTHKIIDAFRKDTYVILNFLAERACRLIDT